MYRIPPRTWLSLIMLLTAALLAGCGPSYANSRPPDAKTPDAMTSRVYRPDLEYFKALNTAGPAGRNPQIVPILASQYLNANQTAAGIHFFETLLSRYDQHLPPPLKSVYLASLGLLRAAHTAHLPLPSRPAWVRETITLLDSAKTLSEGQLFIVRWIAGVVYARLPGRFGKRAEAIRDLTWAQENIDQAPQHGWIREVYFHLALAHQGEGNEEQAQTFLAKSGYTSFDKRTTFTTPYSVNGQDGARMSQPGLHEVIPGTVFTLTGFGFSEIHMVISQDRQHLIAIDMGTAPWDARRPRPKRPCGQSRIPYPGSLATGRPIYSRATSKQANNSSTPVAVSSSHRTGNSKCWSRRSISVRPSVT